MKKPTEKSTKRPSRTTRQLNRRELEETAGGCLHCAVDNWIRHGMPND